MKIRYFIMIVILFCLSSGCSADSKSTAMTGTVVDAETGKPIEGAIVLVEWTKTKGFGLTHTESYKVVEVLTDKDGKFKVPGVRTIFVDSHLTIYKAGYVAWNDEIVFPGYKKRADFEWGKTNTFKLEHFKSEYSYDKHVSFIRSAINSTIGYEKKRIMRDAFDWETDLAREEIKLRK